MTITTEWFKVLDAHCKRVIDDMSLKELRSYALQMKQASFDASFGDGDTNLDDLIWDILEHDNARGKGIKDSKQFLIDCGISEKLAEKTLKDY